MTVAEAVGNRMTVVEADWKWDDRGGGSGQLDDSGEAVGNGMTVVEAVGNGMTVVEAVGMVVWQGYS